MSIIIFFTLYERIDFYSLFFISYFNRFSFFFFFYTEIVFSCIFTISILLSRKCTHIIISINNSKLLVVINNKFKRIDQKGIPFAISTYYEMYMYFNGIVLTDSRAGNNRIYFNLSCRRSNRHDLLFSRQNGRTESRVSYVVHYFFQLNQSKHRTYSKYLVDRNPLVVHILFAPVSPKLGKRSNASTRISKLSIGKQTQSQRSVNYSCDY